MGKMIRELPAELKAKIAAGEVIERPSSVVKELVENSVDAGSTDIAITVVAGGKSLIKVTDNGAGIDPEDCPLVFKPHATSKIHTEEELNRISTMGFRGEALYSISVVSRVTMRTKKRGNLSGTKITIEGGSPPVITEDGCPDGTTVEVRDLFFNTPARRKFLKSERTEFARILDVVKRLSLAHPNIRFRLFNGTSKVLDTGNAGIKERIYHIIDEEVAKRFITAELSRPPYRLSVALSPPELSYPTARLLFINVNRRPVKDSMLTHALVDGYMGMIDSGRYPFALVHIQMPEEYVDVNVHPAKLEVRFKEPRTLYNLLKECVEKALKEKGTQKESPSEQTLKAGGTTVYPSQKTLSGREVPASYEAASNAPFPAPTEELFERDARFVGQLWGEYALFEYNEEFWLIDQHGAMERELYERLRTEYKEKGGLKSQYLLVPERLETTPDEAASLNTFMEEFRRLGFELLPFGTSTLKGGETFLIKAIPHLLTGVSTKELIRDMAEELSQLARGLKRAEEAIERVLMAMACHGVIRGAKTLSKEEALELFKAVERTELSGWCPHGRPVVRRLKKEEIEKFFGRR